jgi:hypothetical protein
MRRSWTPSIVPNGHDQTFYIVINNTGNLARHSRKPDLGEADLETTISDLMSVAFNTSEHWSEDASEDVAREMPCPRRLRRSSKATSVRTVN